MSIVDCDGELGLLVELGGGVRVGYIALLDTKSPGRPEISQCMMLHLL